MKVDMSPKAVKERLLLMDELWLLSVKLMNSKKVKSEKKSENEFSDKDYESCVERKIILEVEK